MYTHAAARTEADRLYARIEAIEVQIDQMEDDPLADPKEMERLGRLQERLEREMDSLSAMDADPAAWGLGWAGDLDPRDTYYT